MIYIALLRGINVGGKNVIKMAELRLLFEGLGLQKVQTYIQSGNVLFVSTEDEELLRHRLEGAILSTFGLKVPIVLRSLMELELIIQNYPFSKEEIESAKTSAEGEVLYVSMFAQDLSIKDIQNLSAYDEGKDKYKIVGRDVYLLFDGSIRNSKLAAKIQKTIIPSTIRNSKTIYKLVELGREM